MVSNSTSLVPDAGVMVNEFVAVESVTPVADFTAVVSTAPAPVANNKYSPQFAELDVTIVKRPR